jgi:hypothetical protein
MFGAGRRTGSGGALAVATALLGWADLANCFMAKKSCQCRRKTAKLWQKNLFLSVIPWCDKQSRVFDPKSCGKHLRRMANHTNINPAIARCI